MNANEYTTGAKNQSPFDHVHPMSLVSYDIDFMGIHVTSELWSALAFIPNVQSLRIGYMYDRDDDDAVRAEFVRWFAYALRHNGMKRLTTRGFPSVPDELDVVRRMAHAANSSQLLLSGTANSFTANAVGLQVVTLKEDARVRTARGFTKRLKEVRSVDGRYPVVAINDRSETVEFVVPGHAVCSTSSSNVTSMAGLPHGAAIVDVATTKDTLEMLDVTSPFNCIDILPGAAAAFVELFGRSLREFRWRGSDRTSLRDFELEHPFDGDLNRILDACPDLELLKLDYTRMMSVQKLLDLYSSTSCSRRLRELQFKVVLIPSTELVKLFTHLADPYHRLSQTLQRLEYSSYHDSDAGSVVYGLDEAAIDAALTMLCANRTLSYVRFAIPSALWEAHHHRFDEHHGVVVRMDGLPLREKLAFLSAAGTPDVPSSDCVLGRLDSSCIAQIFEFLGRRVVRDVHIRKDLY